MYVSFSATLVSVGRTPDNMQDGARSHLTHFQIDLNQSDLKLIQDQFSYTSYEVPTLAQKT